MRVAALGVDASIVQAAKHLDVGHTHAQTHSLTPGKKIKDAYVDGLLGVELSPRRRGCLGFGDLSVQISNGVLMRRHKWVMAQQALIFMFLASHSAFGSLSWGYFGDIFGICLGYAWDMFGIVWEYFWICFDMFGICF